jgi:hypothetical protein
MTSTLPPSLIVIGGAELDLGRSGGVLLPVPTIITRIEEILLIVHRKDI